MKTGYMTKWGERMTTETQGRTRRTCGTCIYLIVTGMALLAIAWGLVDRAASVAATAFLFGGGALIIAPFRRGCRAFGSDRSSSPCESRSPADTETLEGVLPLLTSEEVSVRRVRVPGRFAGRRLVDRELAFLRPGLNISVLAVRQPGDERWQAGGATSELELQKNAQLLVAGPRESLASLRPLVTYDQEDLRKRVMPSRESVTSGLVGQLEPRLGYEVTLSPLAPSG